MCAKKSPTILVADEDRLMRWAIRETLSANGFEVLEASEPAEVVNYLRGCDPEVAIVDVELFRPPSEALVQVLAGFSRNHRVILTTSDPLRVSQLGGSQIDTSQVLEKPVNLDHLAVVVAEGAQRAPDPRSHDWNLPPSALLGRDGKYARPPLFHSSTVAQGAPYLLPIELGDLADDLKRLLALQARELVNGHDGPLADVPYAPSAEGGVDLVVRMKRLTPLVAR